MERKRRYRTVTNAIWEGKLSEIRNDLDILYQTVSELYNRTSNWGSPNFSTEKTASIRIYYWDFIARYNTWNFLLWVLEIPLWVLGFVLCLPEFGFLPFSFFVSLHVSSVVSTNYLLYYHHSKIVSHRMPKIHKQLLSQLTLQAKSKKLFAILRFYCPRKNVVSKSCDDHYNKYLCSE